MCDCSGRRVRRTKNSVTILVGSRAGEISAVLRSIRGDLIMKHWMSVVVAVVVVAVFWAILGCDPLQHHMVRFSSGDATILGRPKCPVCFHGMETEDQVSGGVWEWRCMSCGATELALRSR